MRLVAFLAISTNTGVVSVALETFEMNGLQAV